MRIRLAATLLATLLLFSLASANAATIIAGNDNKAYTSIEGLGDFNDWAVKFSSTLTPGGGGIWNNLTAGILNENGTPFWDNPSLDGAQKNIGYCLLGIGGCVAAGAPYNTQYYATAGGGAVNNLSFTASGAASAQIIAEISAWSGSNTFGWCVASNCAATMQQLFGGAATVGATTPFNPGSSPFLFYSSNGQGQTYFSNTALNVGESAYKQHIGLFDTQDGQVPEPMTFFSLGSGLLALGLIRRFKK